MRIDPLLTRNPVTGAVRHVTDDLLDFAEFQVEFTSESEIAFCTVLRWTSVSVHR